MNKADLAYLNEILNESSKYLYFDLRITSLMVVCYELQRALLTAFFMA